MRHVTAAFLCSCLPAIAAAAEFSVVQTDKSSIAFVSKQMGAPSEGHFGKFSARIAFDPARPENGQAQIDVDLASINAGNADTNDEARGKPWFNTREFPTARFVSTGIRPLGGDRYETTGKMTIKGKTRDVVAPFTAKMGEGGIVIDGGIPILRLQYGIGEGAWADTATVADEVRVRFRFVVLATPSVKK